MEKKERKGETGHEPKKTAIGQRERERYKERTCGKQYMTHKLFEDSVYLFIRAVCQVADGPALCRKGPCGAEIACEKEKWLHVVSKLR